jgi:hypothetical protein
VRKTLAALLFLLLSGVSVQAACPAVATDCGSIDVNNATVGGNLGGVMFATGLAADGVTSDDVALKAGVDRCAAAGAKLVLPTGNILMTGAATVTTGNCHIVGAGTVGWKPTTTPQGTVILLTSTTVKPFQLQSGGSITGVIFFWPNQTSGTTVYPPLMNMDGDSCRWSFTGNVVVNAYDVFADTPGSCQGDWRINENFIYAVHEVLRSSGQGDIIDVSHNNFTPGPWFNMDPANSHTAQAVAAQTNRIFHVENSVGFPWNIMAKDNMAFSWHQIFHLDATAIVAGSDVSFVTDQVNTLIDSTSGGNWAFGNGFSVKGNCNAIVVTGHSDPCFALGPNGGLALNASELGTSGSIIETAGAFVFARDVTVFGFGSQNDGTEYYGLRYSGGVSGTQLVLQNSRIQGNNLSNKAHTHGVSTSAAISIIQVTGTGFAFLQDPVNIVAANTTLFDGDFSASTWGTASFIASGAGVVTYGTNLFDKPPLPVIASGFGTGPSLLAGSDYRSFQINVGTGGTANSGVVTMPFTSNHGHACSAANRTNPATSVPVSVPADNITLNLSNYSRTTGALTAWAASDLIVLNCWPF